MPKLTYFGHDAFLVETSAARLIIDPFLTGNPLTPVSASDVTVDYVLLSHAHGDHFGDALDIAKRCDATIISTFELASYCQSQGAKAHPMHIGGGHDFDFGRVKLTIAHHGNSIDTGEGLISMGPPAGLLIAADGKVLYHAGDTGLFLDMKLIGERNAIDLALLPIGDNFTMGLDDAVTAAEFVNADVSVPMHYDTFDLIKADPNEFVRRVQDTGRKARVIKVGESLDY
ncbi:MAG: metal-dependent hydrolase [Armatimonadetes bacterium]|nr:metal-dependent hydrolase [Armatimonadota bacterium]